MNKDSIENMQTIAASRGGKCLSTDYIDWKTHLRWECAKGHQWTAMPNNVKRGTWCPYCAGVVKPAMEEIKELARQKGGECLSKSYKNAHQKLTWKCTRSHVWQAGLHSTKQGTWCPWCKNENNGIKHRKYTLKDVQNSAKKLGGLCLSKTYSTTHKKLKWKCQYGHIWDMTYGDVLQGKWCPFCSRNISEVFCRLCFEKIFQVPFNKYRPLWLINSEGNRMELDGYSDSLGLAFEYQGEQHYTSKHLFHRRQEDYKKRKRDDKQKIELCKQNNVKIIIVPFFIKFDDILDFIYRECFVQGIKPKNRPKSVEISRELLFLKFRLFF